MSGLTRSTSQQGSRPSPGHAQRFVSPGAQQRYSSSTISSSTSTMRHLGGASQQQQHQQQQNTSLANTSDAGQPQQQFVTVEEFLQLKRALDRERGQREEAVTRLREELFELKDLRRREKLDATVAFAAQSAAAPGAQNGAAGGARFPVPVGGGGGGSGGGAENTILSRLHRIEMHQMQVLPQQLESLEDRLKSRMDDKVKATAEVTKSEFKRASDKIEAVNKEAASARAESAARTAAHEASVAQLQSQLSKTVSQLEVLQTHRVHDEDTRQRIEQELQAHHNFVKEVEAEVRKAQDATTAAAAKFDAALGELQRGSKSGVDEATMCREVDRAVMKERDELREFVLSRVKPLEAQVVDNHSSILQELTTLQTVTHRLDTYEAKLNQVDERATAVEQALGGRTEEQLKELEGRIEASLAGLNAANHTRIKELSTCLEAQIVDKVNEARDEIEDAFSQQMNEANERIDEVARQDAAALQQQQQYVRTLVSELEQGNAVASLILDGTESFIRDMKQEQAAGFATCLERISASRSNEDGPSVADAIKVLYQFERGLGAGLNSLRDDVGSIREAVGLTAAAMAVTSPGRMGGGH